MGILTISMMKYMSETYLRSKGLRLPTSCYKKQLTIAIINIIYTRSMCRIRKREGGISREGEAPPEQESHFEPHISCVVRSLNVVFMLPFYGEKLYIIYTAAGLYFSCTTKWEGASPHSLDKSPIYTICITSVIMNVHIVKDTRIISLSLFNTRLQYFIINRLFMKFSCTNSINVVKDCLYYFGFEILSCLIKNKFYKFILRLTVWKMSSVITVVF